jgi:hypothetical protein
MRLGFHIGPFWFSQRVGRTQAQKRAAAKARAGRQYGRHEARRKADQDSRSFRDVPARDVTHEEGGPVSFILSPPGFPELNIRLEDGHFRWKPENWTLPGYLTDEDFTGLREGDRVSGMLGKDGQSLESLHPNLADRFRYTFTGWAEDITRQPDGGTRFRVVFPAGKYAFHPEGREPAELTLQPGEKVRWADGRPYRMREGSELTVVFDPDGGPPRVYHPDPHD